MPVMPPELRDYRETRDGQEGRYDLVSRVDGLAGWDLKLVWRRVSPRKRKRT
jgi:hypothetical protein